MLKRREGSEGLSFRSFHFAFAKARLVFLSNWISTDYRVYAFCVWDCLHIRVCTSQPLAKDNKAMGDTTHETRGNVKMQKLYLVSWSKGSAMLGSRRSG